MRTALETVPLETILTFNFIEKCLIALLIIYIHSRGSRRSMQKKLLLLFVPGIPGGALVYNLICFNRKEHKDLKDQLLNSLFRNHVQLFSLCSMRSLR